MTHSLFKPNRKATTHDRRRKRGFGRRLHSPEVLEDRLNLTIAFEPAFGFESVIDHVGIRVNTPMVFLDFWGDYWTEAFNPSGAAEKDQIIQNLTASLPAGYLSKLSQYGGQSGISGTGQFGHGIQGSFFTYGTGQEPQFDFSYQDLKDELEYWIGLESANPDQYFPRPSSVAAPFTPIYIAVTGPGVSLVNLPGYHGVDLQSFTITDSEVEFLGWAATTSENVVDSATAAISRNIVNATTDPVPFFWDEPPVAQGPAVQAHAGPQWPQTFEAEIADFEAKAYTHKVGNTMLQSYWSQEDLHFVVPDGNQQNFTLKPIWNGSSYSGTSQLVIEGDQLGDSYDDVVQISTTNNELGQALIQVTLNGETAVFLRSSLAAPGGSLFPIVVNTGGGKNNIDLTGLDDDTIPIFVHDQANSRFSIDDATVNEGDIGNVTAVFTVSFVSETTVTKSPQAVVVVVREPETIDCNVVYSGNADASDVQPLTQILMFSNGATSVSVNIPVNSDTNMERDETFGVILTNPSRGVLVDNFGLGKIVDDDVEAVYTVPTSPLDATWGTDGTVRTPIGAGAYYSQAWGIASDPDGRVLLFGDRTDNRSAAVVRYFPNGSPDPSFGDNGVAALNFNNPYVGVSFHQGASYQSGPNRGKVVAVGTYNSFGISDLLVARFNVDGSPDASFGSGLGYVLVDFNSPFEDGVALAIYESGPQAGEILVVGNDYPGTIAVSLLAVRLTVDGGLDTTFATDGKLKMKLTYTDDDAALHPQDHVAASRVLVDGAGGILIAGVAGLPGSYDGTSYFTRVDSTGIVLRLLDNGALDRYFHDSEFAMPGVVFAPVLVAGGRATTFTNLALNSTGRIVAGGYVGNSFIPNGYVTRLNANGSVDGSFDNTGTVPQADLPAFPVSSVEVDTHDRVLAAGSNGFAAGSNGFLAARFDSQGQPDATFDATNHYHAVNVSVPGSSNQAANDSLLAADGNLILAGYSVLYDSQVPQEVWAFQTVKVDTRRSDLAVTMTSDTSKLLVDGTIEYTVRLLNTGDEAVFPSFRDILPANAEFGQIMSPFADWIITTPAVGSSGTILGTARSLLAAQGEQTLTFKIQLNSTTVSVVNTVTVSSATVDYNLANNSATTSDIIKSVTSTLDSGPGSLRKAIEDANAAPGDDIIKFDFPDAGDYTIVVGSPLPHLHDPATIDVKPLQTVRAELKYDVRLTKTGLGFLDLRGDQSHAAPATLKVSAGAVRLDSDAGPNLSVEDEAAMTVDSVQHLAKVSIGPGAKASLPPGGDKVLVATLLAIDPAGQLDIGDNALVVQVTAETEAPMQLELTAEIAGGRITSSTAAITSSTAAADESQLMTIGVMLNEDALGQPIKTTFAGEAVDKHTILVKYTYFGDALLEGYVSGNSYAMIDNGYNHRLSGWVNGDFNYDGVIDGTDYALIDNTYNHQGTPLSAPATPADAVFDPSLRESVGLSATSASSSMLSPKLAASESLDARAVAIVFESHGVELLLMQETDQVPRSESSNALVSDVEDDLFEDVDLGGWTIVHRF